MKAHLLFEQSGVFKKAFEALGVSAFDYDIEETENVDFKVDIFDQINAYYEGRGSLFDDICKNDVVIAFFPCTYFCKANMFYFLGITKGGIEIEEIIEREKKRHKNYILLLKLIAIAKTKGFRMIVENPTVNSFLDNNLPYDFLFKDKNRTLNGDTFKKPTAFYFYNFKPTFSVDNDFLKIEIPLKIKKVYNTRGIERSKITGDYAINFIKHLIL